MICKLFIAGGCNKERCADIHDKSLYPCIKMFSVGTCESQQTCGFSHEPLRTEKDIEEFIRDNEGFLLDVYKSRRETALGYFFIKYLHKMRETNRQKFESLGVQLPHQMPPYIAPRLLASKPNYQHINSSYMSNSRVQKQPTPQNGFYQNVRGPPPNTNPALLSSLKNQVPHIDQRQQQNQMRPTQKGVANMKGQFMSHLQQNRQLHQSQYGQAQQQFMTQQQQQQQMGAGVHQNTNFLGHQGYPQQNVNLHGGQIQYGQQMQVASADKKQSLRSQLDHRGGYSAGKGNGLIENLRGQDQQINQNIQNNQNNQGDAGNQNFLLDQLDLKEKEKQGLKGEALLGLSGLAYSSGTSGNRGSRQRIQKIFDKLKVSRKNKTNKEEKVALNGLLKKMRGMVFEHTDAPDE